MRVHARLDDISQRLFTEPAFAQSLMDCAFEPLISQAIADEMSTWQSWPKDVPGSLPLLWLATHSQAWAINPYLAPSFAHALARYMDVLAAQNVVMDVNVQNQLGVGVTRAHKMWSPRDTIAVIRALSKTHVFDTSSKTYKTRTPAELIADDLLTHASSIDSGRFKRIYYNTLPQLQSATLAERRTLLPWLLARESFSADAADIELAERMYTIIKELAPEDIENWRTLNYLRAPYMAWISNAYAAVQSTATTTSQTIFF